MYCAGQHIGAHLATCYKSLHWCIAMMQVHFPFPAFGQEVLSEGFAEGASSNAYLLFEKGLMV